MKERKLSNRKPQCIKRVVLLPKQDEILSCLAGGLKNAEIAARMRVSVSVITLLITDIMLQLEVKTRSAAVIKAQELNLI